MKSKSVSPESYVVAANRRIDALESLILEKLVALDQPEFLNPEEKTSLLNYLKDLKSELEVNSTNLLTYRTKRKNGSLGPIISRSYSSHISNISSCSSLATSSPTQSLFLGPIMVGKYSLSSILSSSVDVYCNRLDPKAYWFTREEVASILRYSESSLIKRLVLDSCLGLSNLTPFERNLLKSTRVPNLITEAYADPSLNNIIGLIFLCFDALLHHQIEPAKKYISSAFRMSDMLGLTSLDLPLNSLSPSEILKRNRICQVMSLLFNTMRQLLGDSAMANRLFHLDFDLIDNTEVNFPIFSQWLSREFNKEGSVNQKDGQGCRSKLLPFKKDLCQLQKASPPASESKLHGELIRIVLALYQDSIELQAKSLKSNYLAVPSGGRLTLEQKADYKVRLLSLIVKLPEDFRRPKLLPKKLLWDDLTSQLDHSDRDSLFKNTIYANALIAIAYIYYPALWFNFPRPMILSDEAFEGLIDINFKLYEYYIELFSLFYNHPNPSTIIFNQIAESVYPIYSYLNLILYYDQIDDQTKQIFFQRVQKLINLLKLISGWDHAEDERTPNIILDSLCQNLERFNLPEEYLPQI